MEPPLRLDEPILAKTSPLPSHGSDLAFAIGSVGFVVPNAAYRYLVSLELPQSNSPEEMLLATRSDLPRSMRIKARAIILMRKSWPVVVLVTIVIVAFLVIVLKLLTRFIRELSVRAARWIQRWWAEVNRSR